MENSYSSICKRSRNPALIRCTNNSAAGFADLARQRLRFRPSHTTHSICETALGPTAFTLGWSGLLTTLDGICLCVFLSHRLFCLSCFGCHSEINLSLGGPFVHKGAYFLKEVDCIPRGFLTQCLLPLKKPCFPAGGGFPRGSAPGTQTQGAGMLATRRYPLQRIKSSDSPKP